MSKYLVIFFSLAVLSFLYWKVADKLNIIDKPNHRSSHTQPTIRGGGVLFFFGLLIAFYLSGFQFPYFVLGTTMLAILSFVDDIITLSAKIRWPFQFLAVLLLLYQIGFDYFPIWSYIPVVILAVGFVNLFNFLDGINGITGLSALVVLGAFLYVNQDYQVVDNSFLITLMLSVVVFGYFNFRKKALMFAGDVGSITMGMIIFFLGIKYIIATGSPLIICLYMVFGADSTLTLLYRVAKREKLSEAHRNHIYQKLVDNFKFSHLQVSIYYFLLQILVSLFTIYILYNVDLSYHFIIGVGISQVLTLIYVLLFRKHAKEKKREEG